MSTNKKTTVFLGGTCNGSLWRDTLIPLFDANKVEYFNPVLPPGVKWDETYKQSEIKARNSSDIVLYVITPKMTGFYSVAEVVEDSNKRPEKTIFCFLEKDGDAEFSAHQNKSLIATGDLVKNNGAKAFKTIEQLAEYVNSHP